MGWRVWWCHGGACAAAQLVVVAVAVQVLLAWVDTTAGAVIVPESLKVAVTKVTGDGAELSWATSAGRRQAMTSCSLHYGPLTEAVDVQTALQKTEQHISLAHLTPHTTYYAFLSCTHAATTYHSNTVHFTPHGDPAVALEVRPPPPPPPPAKPSSPWSPGGGGSKDGTGQSAGDGGIVVMMSQRHMDAPRRDPHSAVPSTSVILGAVCGVVGFLIINVTVVMAVRQYSHRRARRRRLLELQLEQHGGYLYNFEQLMADYNQQINAGNS
ncbi:uncharacterized protein [Panulirus ornatus]|uniref:uncharacterized protein n=1 Tax=Panulirus ornatus TaxID=150431 RepID=UPI003A849E17